MVGSNRLIKIKDAYYDVGTSNKSFLQVAQDLKTLGRKNYYFMLKLYDPTLINVDPYNPDITKDEINRVILECSKNMWYYLREIAKIANQGGPPTQYSAHRGNIAQAWCAEHAIANWLNVSRQKGKTQGALTILNWAYSFGTNNSQIMFVNKKESDAIVNLGRMQDQISFLPKFLQFVSIYDAESGKTARAINSAKKARHPVTKNEILVMGKATSYDAAVKLGRGLTSPIMHMDEFEFTEYIKTIMENSAPAFVKASQNAKLNSAFTCKLITSTPGDLDSKAGAEASLVLNDCANFTEEFYDMTADEISDFMRDNSKNDIVYIEFNYKQLREDEIWFQEMVRGINNPLTLKREVLLMRIHGSSDSPFDQEDIDYIIRNTHVPSEEIRIKGHFIINKYKNINKNVPYIIGVDCSTGILKDSNAFTMIDPYTLDIVAEFKCNFIGEIAFADLLVDVILDICPKGILCIERNSIGDAVVEYLLEKTPIGDRLYFDKNKDLLESRVYDVTNMESVLKKKALLKPYYGVYTHTNRNDMISILQNHMVSHKDKFITKYINSDISKLVQKNTGKIEARSGENDDSIMSYLIALYVYYHGNNLSVFGFIKGSADIVADNSGMNRPISDLDANILPKEIIEAAKKEIDVDLEYAADFARALQKSQDQSRLLNLSTVDVNNQYSTTPSEVLDSLSSSSMYLRLFDELNNF